MATKAYQLPPLVRLTDGTASGLWPTPQVQYDGRTQEAWEKAKAEKAAKHKAGDYGKGTGAPGMMDLQRAVRMWPTPNTVDAKGGSRNGSGQAQLCHQVGGSLNPTWVEWLMGFPLGWTDCGASGMLSSRKSRKSSAGQS